MSALKHIWPFAPDKSDPLLSGAFRRAERDGLALLTRARAIVLLVIAAWLILQFPRVEVLWTVGLCILFALSGILQWRLIRRHPGRRWLLFLFAALDVLVVTLATIVPNPLLDKPPPLPLLLRLGSFAYFFILVTMTGLLTSPALTLWTGVWVAGVWLAGTELIALTDGAFKLSDLPDPPAFNSPRALEAYGNLFLVDVVQSRQNAVVVLLVAGLLRRSSPAPAGWWCNRPGPPASGRRWRAISRPT